eukprot:TRINITY_DN4562_c0_g1_i1.p1 TRINITY_DN4562_c0_g1~~TRINITY_DN4562_c0_g1_i1.p1  ORF type:complete len:213 (+),score=33.45 TRINITY_DN4562_c0_g1_i1:108-746(+)
MSNKSFGLSFWRVLFFGITSCILTYLQWEVDDYLKEITYTGTTRVLQTQIYYTDIEIAWVFLDFDMDCYRAYLLYLGINSIACFFYAMFICDLITYGNDRLVGYSHFLHFLDGLPFIAGILNFIENVVMAYFIFTFPFSLKLDPPVIAQNIGIICTLKHCLYYSLLSIGTILLILSFICCNSNKNDFNNDKKVNSNKIDSKEKENQKKEKTN